MAKKGYKISTKKQCIALLEELYTWFMANDKNISFNVWLAKKRLHKDKMRHIWTRFPDLKEEYYQMFKGIQEERILEKGYTESSAMSIFQLKCNHDYSPVEHQEIKHTGDYSFKVPGAE